MRPIDADALKEAIINVIEAEESIDKKWATGLKYSLAIIDSALTCECKTCKHRDPEDKKCDCGGQERQGCYFPVSDDYFCKFYEKGGVKC